MSSITRRKCFDPLNHHGHITLLELTEGIDCIPNFPIDESTLTGINHHVHGVIGIISIVSQISECSPNISSLRMATLGEVIDEQSMVTPAMCKMDSLGG
jgi:hypothetical protein